MIKKTITYTDYNGHERTEDFHFNLSKFELLEMEHGTAGSLSDMLKKISTSNDEGKLIEYFKTIILKSYGVKTEDGKQFIKNDELRDSFLQTEAYSELFMELAYDADAAINFIKGIVPPSTLVNTMPPPQNP